jgi:hypothetical protein
MCIIINYRACSSEARARGYELRCRGFDSLLAQFRHAWLFKFFVLCKIIFIYVIYSHNLFMIKWDVAKW